MSPDANGRFKLSISVPELPWLQCHPAAKDREQFSTLNMALNEKGEVVVQAQEPESDHKQAPSTEA